MKTSANRIIGLSAILFLLAIPVRTQAPQSATRLAEIAPFSPGEQLSFDLSWNIFTAGGINATLTRVPDSPGDSYRVLATATSRGFVSLLFAVDDEYQSFFNAQTLCSERLTKKINEGRRHKDTRLVFDSGRKLALLDERDLARPSSPPKHVEQSIPACVEDVISAFYTIRRQPLRVGATIALPINDGSKTVDVRVEVQALEKVKVPFGERMAYRLEPTVFGGALLKRRGRMLIWISDDDRRLPLRIKATIAVGTISADLRSVKSVAPTAADPALPSPKP